MKSRKPFSRRTPKQLIRKRRIATSASLLTIALLFFIFSGYAKVSKGSMLPEGDYCKVVIPDETPEIMCFYTGFTVSFNPAWHVPNYVVWELTADETDGEQPRRSRFAADPNVYGCASLQDYRNSGFDRGHMAPAADMKWSVRAMDDCHFLTNIVPQDRQLNAGRWNSLEQKCRAFARRDSVLVIVAGPVLTDRITRTIGANRVAVPERFFKVLLTPYTNPPKAIGFIMSNRQVSDPLNSLAMSVDQIEEITGFDFFSELPDDIENQLESNFSLRAWGLL